MLPLPRRLCLVPSYGGSAKIKNTRRLPMRVAFCEACCRCLGIKPQGSVVCAPTMYVGEDKMRNPHVFRLSDVVTVTTSLSLCYLFLWLSFSFSLLFLLLLLLVELVILQTRGVTAIGAGITNHVPRVQWEHENRFTISAVRTGGSTMMGW